MQFSNRLNRLDGKLHFVVPLLLNTVQWHKTGFNKIPQKAETKKKKNVFTSLKPDASCFQAWLYFYPTEDQQKTCQGCGDQGLNGDLVVVYDVNRDTSLGDVKVQKVTVVLLSISIVHNNNNKKILPEMYILSTAIFSTIFSNQSYLLLTPPRHQTGTLFITLLHIIFPAYQKMLSSLLIKVAQCTARKYNRYIF